MEAGITTNTPKDPNQNAQRVRRLNDLNRDGVSDHLEGTYSDPSMERAPTFESYRSADAPAKQYARLDDALRGYVRDGDSRLQLQTATREPIQLISRDDLTGDFKYESPSVAQAHAAAVKLDDAEAMLDKSSMTAGLEPSRELQEFDRAISHAQVDLQERHALPSYELAPPTDRTADAAQEQAAMLAKEDRKQADMEVMANDPELQARIKADDAQDVAAMLAKEDRKQADIDALEKDPEHQAALRRHFDAEFHNVIRNRETVSADVAEKGEVLANAVDLARGDQVDPAELANRYEQAAMAYAQAVKAQADFEAKPAHEHEVVAEYRKLQELEQQQLAHEQAKAHARIDGDAQAEQQADAMLQQAVAARGQFLKERGVSPDTPIPQPPNHIERPLSEDAVQTLVAAQQLKKSKADLDEDADKVATHVADRNRTASLGEAHNQVQDNSAFNGAQSKDKLVPEDVAAAYKRDGEKYLDANDPKRVAFVDKGNRLQTIRTFDDKAVSDMVEVADSRGWGEIKVTGDEAFRRKAWLEATSRGIEVKGYEPNEKDLQLAETLARRNGKANGIEKNEVVEAYKLARDGDGKAKREAAEKHPELANAFALEQAVKSFAKQRLSPESQQRLVDSIRTTIEKDLASGKKIPEVRLRQERDRKQEHGVER